VEGYEHRHDRDHPAQPFTFQVSELVKKRKALKKKQIRQNSTHAPDPVICSSGRFSVAAS